MFVTQLCLPLLWAPNKEKKKKKKRCVITAADIEREKKVFKVGILADSQACPPGLLMPPLPGHTSANLGCEN